MPKSMLVVIDDQVMAKWLPHHFENRGWVVKRAENERQALDLLSSGKDRFRPDVLIIDAVLRDSDGYALVQDAKIACPQAFLIVTSARTGRAAQLKAIAAGADAYISKPFPLADLEALVSRAGTEL